MRRNPLLLIMSALFAIIFIASCQKETEPGEVGPPGPAGPKGDTGVANVIYSGWFDVTYTQVVPQPGDTGYVAQVDAPKLTKDILDKGEIKIYINLNTPADPSVFPLPFFNGAFLISPSFEIGKIFLESNIDAGTFTDGGNKIAQYRYVLIPGGVLAAKPANVNLDNYAEAQKYLKIK